MQNRLCESLQKGQIWACSCLAFGFILLVNLVFDCKFETNDDALMMHLVAGSMSGETSEFVVFSHIWWAKILVFLYQNAPMFNWYPLLFMLCHGLFLSYFTHFILTKTNKDGVLFWLCLIFGIETLILTHLQFTSTSILLGIAGVLAFVENLQKRSVLGYSLSFLFLLLCVLIRWESLIAVALLTFLYPLGFLKPQNYKNLVVAVVFLLVFLGLRQIQLQAYHSFENALITPNSEEMRRLIDLPTQPFSTAQLQSVAWSENDYNLLQSWFWADNHFYNHQNINNLANISRFSFSPKDKIKSLGSFGFHNLGFVIFVIVVLVLKRNFIFKIRNWTIILPFVASLLLFMLFERNVPRVIVPLFLGFLLLLLQKSQSEKHEKQHKLPLQIIAILLPLLAQIGLYLHQNRANKIAFEKGFSVLQKYPNSLIINKDSWLNLEGCPLWKNPNLYSPKNFMYVDFLRGYPVYEHLIKKQNIPNLMPALWQRNDIYLLTDQADDICQFAKEHYGISIKVEYLDKDVVEGVNLVKLVMNNE